MRITFYYRFCSSPSAFMQQNTHQSVSRMIYLSFDIFTSQTFPFFGVVPELLTEEGKVIEGEGEGYLVSHHSDLANFKTVSGDVNHLNIVCRLHSVLFKLKSTQVFKQPWPGIMRTVYGNHERFETTYFKKFPGYYTTGDGM